MNIAVLTHFFPPEPCAAANRAQGLVEALLRAGHDVTVITAFPSFPDRKMRPEDRRRFIAREQFGGARIVRLFTFRPGRIPGAKLIHWLVSAAAMSAYALAHRRFDAAIVTVPPITLAAPALLLARRGTKFIVDVRDVFPDVAVAMGEWRAGGVAARAAEAVMRALYKRADLIAGVTPAVVDAVANRLEDTTRLILSRNGCDDLPEVLRTRNGDVQLQALYVGNFGLATDLEVVLDAAARLRGQPHISFSIVGGGAQAQTVRRRVVQMGLNNVTIGEPVQRHAAIELMTNADVALVPLRKGISDSVPTKIYDAFSAGCPVIVCAEGEAASIVEQSGGGFCVPAGDGEQLARALQHIAALERSARLMLGERGRAFVRRFCRRDTIMDDYCAHIAALQDRIA